ncbi:mitochondria-eating protein [Meriones unguiculatus]|uniref:mitochondria-eating protein n=1 Tax=Meriones unguiculatus TaxID=10047 RepID=UPI00293EE25A|nr:mitochondria-eating protein [Meriones unguiculatus]
MADNLKKLARSESFRELQNKVTYWVKDYNTNSCDQNLNYCIGLIEQVGKIQAQLFGILTVTAQEGGHNEGVETIKTRLLPMLETTFSNINMIKLMENKQDPQLKDKNRVGVSRDQEEQLSDGELNPDNQQNQVQDDLTESGKSLDGTKNRSTISLMAAEEEINQLKKQLKSLQAQEDARHRQTERRLSETVKSERRPSSKWKSEPRVPDVRSQEVISDYEKHLQNLKDEIAVLSAEKSSVQSRPAFSRSPSPNRHCSNHHSRSHSRSHSRTHSRSGSHSGSHSRSRSRGHSRGHSRTHSRSRSHSRSNSPCTDVVKARSPSPNRAKTSSLARKAALLSRFSDAYSQARLDAQCLLRRCIDRAETVQRIIYIATVEAFHVAKMAFRHFKIRVRKMLTPSHVGPNDFENSVSDYIVCHLDLYDSQSSVNDVIRAMNVNPKISFPPEVDFCLLTDFIQEICCIAFAMQSLEPPLDIAFGADGEVFNDCKYRRSYDSDFTAPLVFYHVWPALMENDCVVMKGEAVTKRGAFWSSVRPVTRCRSRSLSPICPRTRIGLSTISRSRSPSPIRCTVSRY